MSSGGDEAAAASKRPLRFLDLPLETQNDIIDHCSQSELVCLAVVSKHFHELVSAKLYRNFHIVFPDDDDIDFGSPIDGLAGGLDTFTTSEYNYAKHLRDLSMDTLSPGRKGELSYQPYLYSATCGKFFNTLLYLTLKKAKFLEGFTWNIRVELTRQVYSELHKLPSLKKLHVRMQTGESYYTPPPPLPITLSPLPPPVPSNSHWQSNTHSSLSYGHAMLEPPPSVFSSSKPFPRNKSPKKQPAFGPPTFSGFKNLSTLAVLDIDSLDCVSEIQSCVKQSYSTLTELQLSLSDTLAGQARRPPVDSDTESSDSEELYEAGNSYESNRPAKVFRAQEEKKRQDLILSRVFDVEPGLVKKPQIQRSTTTEAPAPAAGIEDVSNQNAARAEEFVASWKEISTRLMAGTNGSKEFSTDQQNILDIIEQAARKYVSYEKTKTDEPDIEEPSANPTADPVTADVQLELPIRLATRESNSLIDQATPSQGLDELADNHEMLSRSNSHRASKKESSNSMAIKGKAVEPAASTNAAPISDTESETSEHGSRKKSVDEYIKTTRGLSLETLALHLVPVRASVLSRALDLTTLKSLTLLNVGNQAPIWNMLMNENKVRPLALRSLFTDNASLAFLTCVSQLEEVHDLFMLERNIDHKPESFAPRAATTIDQIRRLVLKKHVDTLKRLMIKDDTKEASWDANEKTMILLCTRGKALEELAVSMNIHAVHAFMQYFSGMASLRAINILHFKNSDTCLWVMREVLRFIVDNLSHYPELKLEWIAMEDDRVDRVVRPNDLLDDQLSEEEKAKQKPPKPRAPSIIPTGTFPQAPLDQIDYGSESEDETFDSGGRLRLQTEGPLQFYDVWGVKIFDKEIRSGQL